MKCIVSIRHRTGRNTWPNVGPDLKPKGSMPLRLTTFFNFDRDILDIY